MSADGIKNTGITLNFDLDNPNKPAITGLPASAGSGQPVEHDQLNTALAAKQENLTGGSCIEIDNGTVNFLIGSTGTDHSELILNGSGFGTLDGTYAVMSYNGSFQQVTSAQDLDLVVGGNDNIYAKPVDDETWAVIGKRGSYWWAALTNTNPNSVTQTVESFIVEYVSVEDFFITQASEQDSEGDNSPASSERVDYAVGGNPGGILVQNGKAVLDFASTIANAASSNVFSAALALQYINEQDAYYRLAHNQVFNNAVAQLANDPNNPQAAIEALKELADAISQSVSTNQVAASTQYSKIAKLQTLNGTTEDHHGDLTHALLPDNATTPAVFEALAAAVAAVRADAETTLGLMLGDLVSGVGGSVPSGLDLKGVVSYIAQELADLGSDQFSRMPVAHFYHFAGPGFQLTPGQIAGTEPFNEAGYTLNDVEGNQIDAEIIDLSSLSYDARILIDYGVGGHVNAGVWTRDHVTGYITRADYFDEPSEISKGAHIKILYGGAIAGADFAVVNASNPVVGTDPIEFLLDDYLRIGDGTITKSKFDDTLTAAFDAKTQIDTSAALRGVVLAPGLATTLSHGYSLGNYVAQVYHAAGSSDTMGELFSDEIVLKDQEITVRTGSSGVIVDIVILGA